MNLRPFYQEGFISAIVCLSAYMLFSNNQGLEEHVQPFADVVARIVPSVLVMSDKALNPQLAKITWAIQWIFFPIYLVTLLNFNRPWSKQFKDEIMKNPYGTRFGFGHSLRMVLLLIGMLCIILSDFGVINLLSFIQGTGFEIVGSVSKYPAQIRAPFTSNFGMLLYAWFFPFGVALMYWVFLAMLLNLKTLILGNGVKSDI